MTITRYVVAPDEAAHHGLRGALKVHCLERVDAEVLRPVVEQFLAGVEALGGVVADSDRCPSSSPGAAREPVRRPCRARRCDLPRHRLPAFTAQVAATSLPYIRS